MDTLLLTQFEPRTNFYVVDALLAGNWPALRLALAHLLLLSVTLGWAGPDGRVRPPDARQHDRDAPAGFHHRGAARLGLPERRLTYRHALRNTFIPILTMIGLQFAILLAGAAHRDDLFVGSGWAVTWWTASSSATIPRCKRLSPCSPLFVAFISLPMDLVNAFVDPRIRY